MLIIKAQTKNWFRIVMAFTAITALFAVFVFPATLSAHESDVLGTANTIMRDSEAKSALAVDIAVVGGIIIMLSVGISLIAGDKKPRLKASLFWAIAIATIIPTLYFAGSTVYQNINSESGGPVHWHADFRIFVCGEEVELAGPVGALSNKVGNAVYHHHDDKRVHIEGVISKFADFELEDFFSVIGGELTDTHFTIPSTEGKITVQNESFCASGERGEWQVYLYSQDTRETDVFKQSKLVDYPHYGISPHASVPPGDCIIFEFGPTSERSEHLCTFYELAKEKGEITIR